MHIEAYHTGWPPFLHPLWIGDKQIIWIGDWLGTINGVVKKKPADLLGRSVERRRITKLDRKTTESGNLLGGGSWSWWPKIFGEEHAEQGNARGFWFFSSTIIDVKGEFLSVSTSRGGFPYNPLSICHCSKRVRPSYQRHHLFKQWEYHECLIYEKDY